MFKVVLPFFDLQDGNREYHPGDTFPRDGLKVSTARLAELASSNNRRGFPVIEEVKEQEEAKPTRKRVKKDAD
jgi:hypothetical protein